MIKHNKCQDCQYSEFEEEVYEVTCCSLKQNIENNECKYFEQRYEI